MTGPRPGVVAAGARPPRAGILLSPRGAVRLTPSMLDPLPRRTVPAERPAHPRPATRERRVNLRLRNDGPKPLFCGGIRRLYSHRHRLADRLPSHRHRLAALSAVCALESLAREKMVTSRAPPENPEKAVKTAQRGVERGVHVQDQEKLMVDWWSGLVEDCCSVVSSGVWGG